MYAVPATYAGQDEVPVVVVVALVVVVVGAAVVVVAALVVVVAALVVVVAAFVVVVTPPQVKPGIQGCPLPDGPLLVDGLLFCVQYAAVKFRPP